MVFCSTCANTQRVALMLRNLGFTAIPLHGQMSQVITNIHKFFKAHFSQKSMFVEYSYSYSFLLMLEDLFYS